jgi:hypothetical protein
MSSIENSKVSLGIYGDDLDPSELTNLLKCEPTEAKRKGEVIRRKQSSPLISTIGRWILESDLYASAEIEVKINGILDKVSSDLEVWKSINERFTTRIFCGLFISSFNEGFDPSPQILKRLSERELKIEFDIYGFMSDSDSTESS